MSEKGFSVIEIILASVLFLLFAGGAVAVILEGFQANRLGEEQTIATQYASEGLEAVRSIRNQSYSSLASTSSAGLRRAATGVWTWFGTQNVFTKYTRVIVVSSVQRDVNGNIVASGGAVDPDTKKVTSTVSWNVSSARNDSVVLTTYYTNWRGGAASCAVYCQGLGIYTTGTCRSNPPNCVAHGETYESGGNAYCAPGQNLDICCCL